MATGRTLYILDEPTTGLHFEDVRILLGVLHSLVERGNTVVVIEHNLHVVKRRTWSSTWGRREATRAGAIVVEGTPETVAGAGIVHGVSTWRRCWRDTRQPGASPLSVRRGIYPRTARRCRGEVRFWLPTRSHVIFGAEGLAVCCRKSGLFP